MNVFGRNLKELQKNKLHLAKAKKVKSNAETYKFFNEIKFDW